MKLKDGREFDPNNPPPGVDWPETPCYNVYVCEGTDRHANLSVDLDKGVTPFMTSCAACGEPAQSRMYRAPGTYQAYLPVVMVWRKPTNAERKDFKRRGIPHYEDGGLAK